VETLHAMLRQGTLLGRGAVTPDGMMPPGNGEKR